MNYLNNIKNLFVNFDTDFKNLIIKYKKIQDKNTEQLYIIELINQFIQLFIIFLNKYKKLGIPSITVDNIINISIDDINIEFDDEDDKEDLKYLIKQGKIYNKFIFIYNISYKYLINNNKNTINIAEYETIIEELYKYMTKINEEGEEYNEDNININVIALELLNNIFIEIFELSEIHMRDIYFNFIKEYIYSSQIYYYLYNNNINTYYDEKFNNILDNITIKIGIFKLFNIINILIFNKKIDDTFIIIILLYIHTYMHNITNVNKLQLDEIDNINIQFKIIFNKIKKNLITNSNYKIIIDKIDDDINEGFKRNKIIELFNRPYHNEFISYIPLKRLRECNTSITNITPITKNSSSNSIVYKALYDNNPCYIKVFQSTSVNKNDNLLYEQKIYRYLKNRDTDLKIYYQNYFVKVYDVFKMYDKEFINLINNKASNNIFNYFNNNDYRYLIITEDIEGETYADFIDNNISDTKLIINTLFDVIYGIYIMNDKLKIYHNDNHFNNILIKIKPSYETNYYQIDKIEYSRRINYRVCFYDFDFSYLENENNPKNINPLSYPKNVKSASDIWFIMKDIYKYLYDKNYTDIDKFIKDIILNNSPKLVKSSSYYKNKIRLNWNLKYDNIYLVSQYCKKSKNFTSCEKPHHPELYAINVLKRFLSNDTYCSMIDFIEVDTFYKKYIKYKQKYIELKNT
jgi:hypothetical protein